LLTFAFVLFSHSLSPFREVLKIFTSIILIHFFLAAFVFCPPFPRFRFSAFPLSRFPAFPLSRFPAFPLSRFPAFPLFRFSAFPLFRFSTFPLFRFSAFPLSNYFANILRTDKKGKKREIETSTTPSEPTTKASKLNPPTSSSSSSKRSTTSTTTSTTTYTPYVTPHGGERDDVAEQPAHITVQKTAAYNSLFKAERGASNANKLFSGIY
jgi:hypothetical protein